MKPLNDCVLQQRAHRYRVRGANFMISHTTSYLKRHFTDFEHPIRHGRFTGFRQLNGGRALTAHWIIDCGKALPKSLPNFPPAQPEPCRIAPTSTGVSD